MKGLCQIMLMLKRSRWKGCIEQYPSSWLGVDSLFFEVLVLCRCWNLDVWKCKSLSARNRYPGIAHALRKKWFSTFPSMKTHKSPSRSG